jgi:hypothetical protein
MKDIIKIGIDPGVNGAMAVCWPDGKITVHPFITESDMVEEISAIADLDAKVYCTLERVRSRPGQGVASTFKFGANYGFWRGLLQAHGFVFREVTPQQWQSGLGIKKGISKTEHKNALKQLACERHPEIKVNLKTADALLILESML